MGCVVIISIQNMTGYVSDLFNLRFPKISTG
ncbi:putative protein encoded by prophage [Escherichia coli B108]|nr:putative protein encoded by prophage [Escherichia coli B108]